MCMRVNRPMMDEWADDFIPMELRDSQSLNRNAVCFPPLIGYGRMLTIPICYFAIFGELPV